MELFDILNEDGSKKGIKKERKAVHRDGDLHGSVHIWIIREKDGRNQVLLQKRKRNKDSYPGFYDAACTGHIDAGEDEKTAAIRELLEELNIRVDFSELKFITKLRVSEKNIFHNKIFINNEITYVFLLDKYCDLSSLTYQESEIEKLLWIDCDDLIKELEKTNSENSERKYCLNLNEFIEVNNVVKTL